MITTAPRREEIQASAATAALDLLCDHLNGALDHCEAIERAHVRLGASVESGANGRAILRQNRTVSDFVTELRARELAIALRLTQAGIVAERAAGLSRAVTAVASLVKSGAAVVVDAGTRVASQAQDRSVFAYLVARGLLEAGATSLPDELESGEHFIVLGVMTASDVRAFLDAALLAVDNLAAMRA